MQDIFISPLSTGLISWVEAFPKAKIAASVKKPTKLQKDEAIVFWLHMNADRQQWLTGTITLIQNSYKNSKIV
jgi:hypothetical protein